MKTKRFAATSILTTFASQAWICTAAYSRQGSEAFLDVRLTGTLHRLQSKEVFRSPLDRDIQRQMVSTFPGNDDAVTVEGDEWTDVLPFEKSAHNSATIFVPEETSSLFDRDTFRSRLEGTCEVLREMDKSSVWVEVPMSRASLIEEMSSLGFVYHHAEGSTARLNLWLRDSESKVPEYATHHLGVGAVVVNSRDEILCVRELRMNYMPWKVPGGLSELGESISDAAEREVLEETGVPTKFHSILSFRHAHGLANGRSDLYFVCRLDPIEEVDGDGNAIIPKPCAQECEIEATAWVPMSEYRAMVDGTDDQPGHPMMRNVMKVYDERIRIKQKEVKSVVPGRKSNPLYLPVLADDSD
jgi:ADP-ribose pyrophosphatase YjhB (NUDIX family)